MPSFLNRSSGKLLTVFQGDGSGEGIKDESEDQGNDRENTYEDIMNGFHDTRSFRNEGMMVPS